MKTEEASTAATTAGADLAQENESLRQELAKTNSLTHRAPVTPAKGARAKAPPEIVLNPAALAEENERLKRQIADRADLDKQTEADEDIIKQKMALGLTRLQAVAVIKRQRDYDEACKPMLAQREQERARRRQINEGIAAVYGLTPP